MSTNIKKLILKKNKGNITSLIFGQLFIFLMLIWCLFSYRLTILNAVFNYVDDSLTSSCLGAALVNVEEYGKSNQLIIHNTESYPKVPGSESSATSGWEEDEANILISELNYNSDIRLKPSELEKKEVISIDNRDEYADDDYLERALSAFAYCFGYNLSNGRYSNAYSAEHPISGVGVDSLDSGGIKLYPRDGVLTGSILNDYIVSDIEVVRFDIYSVYRTRLASRHVYASEYMKYNIGGASLKYSDLVSSTDRKLESADPITITWVGDEVRNAKTRQEFINANKPYKYVLKASVKSSNALDNNSTGYKNKDYTTIAGDDSNFELNPDGTKKEYENYSEQLLAFNKKYKTFDIDLDSYETKPLICYTDTQTSYQGKFDKLKNKDGSTSTKDRVAFKYFFTHQNGTDPGTNGLYNGDIKLCAYDEESPIEYWSVYSYKEDSGVIFDHEQKTGAEHLHPKIISRDNDGEKMDTLGNTYIEGKMDGADIEHTSVYVELRFTIKTFPTPDTWIKGKDYSTLDKLNPDTEVAEWRMNTTEDKSIRTVTVARLVDIELNTDAGITAD